MTTANSTTIPALSVVAPWGDRIASKTKTIEVRSWRPDELPIDDLLIVENRRRLTHENDVDTDGRAVAVVCVADVHDWLPEEAEAACSTWEAGRLAWSLDNIRPIHTPIQMLAARKIYDVRVTPEFVEQLKLSCNLKRSCR